MEYYQEQRLSDCQKAPTVHGGRATCVDEHGASAGAGYLTDERSLMFFTKATSLGYSFWTKNKKNHMSDNKRRGCEKKYICQIWLIA